MPIYEYQCTNCDNHLDMIQKINDEPATKCPKCSKDTLVKLVSAAGFQLKGTGWYQTDFKTPKPVTNNSGSKESQIKDSKSSESNSSTTNKGETT